MAYNAYNVDVRTKYPSPHISYYKNGPHATVFCGVVFPGAEDPNIFENSRQRKKLPNFILDSVTMGFY
jgi:hypothetical protein